MELVEIFANFANVVGYEPSSFRMVNPLEHASIKITVTALPSTAAKYIFGRSLSGTRYYTGVMMPSVTRQPLSPIVG
jgi:hypothetical protein